MSVELHCLKICCRRRSRCVLSFQSIDEKVDEVVHCSSAEGSQWEVVVLKGMKGDASRVAYIYNADKRASNRVVHVHLAWS